MSWPRGDELLGVLRPSRAQAPFRCRERVVAAEKARRHSRIAILFPHTSGSVLKTISSGRTL